MRKKLIEEYPHFIEEWVTEKNDRPIEEITIGSDYKAWWKCKKCSHQWKATIGSRTKGTDCPLCVGRTGISLSDKFPQLSEEWMLEENHKPINSITAGSAYKAWWKCKTCDNQWQKPVNQRVKGSGCPKCARKKKGLLVDQSPQLVEEWMTEKNDKPIEDITSGSRYKAWWHCKTCDNQWQALVHSRTTGAGCRPCSDLKRKKQPYIIDVFQYLAKEWVSEKNNREIEGITAGSGYKAWWKCKKCSHEWQARVARRIDRKTGCPKCAGKDKGLLVDQSPQLVEEWVTEKNDRPIEEITIGSDYKAWWKCKKCNREWHALVISRAINNSGCPKCAKIKKKPELI